MDWSKSILSALKYLLVGLAGAALGALIGALTLALGFAPQGLMPSWAWQFIVLPILTAAVGWLQNIYKHINDGKTA